MTITLRHLNADTSWLISFENFNILIDPWLTGSQTDYFRSFSTQEHAIAPSIQDISRDLSVPIDAIVISHEFTDHCHEQTLRTLSGNIPVFATKNAYRKIRRWNYFEYVYEIPTLTEKPEMTSLFCLCEKKGERSMPSTISVGYLPEKGLMALPSLHGATCLFFRIDETRWHSLLYIPHGCAVNSITKWFHQQTHVRASVLLQGFQRVSNPIWLGGLLNYGCTEAIKVIVALKIPHWIATHDENKIAHGFVAKFLKRDNSTIEQATGVFNKINDQHQCSTKILDVPNGETIELEL